MGEAIDRLGALILDTTLAASTILIVVALAMVGNAQPARRCALARGAILALLALIPLAAWGPMPRVDVLEPLRAILQPPGPRPAPPDSITAALPGDLGPSRGLMRSLTWLYLAGVTAGLAGLALGVLGSAWLCRRSSLPSATTSALYRSLPATDPRPRLRVVDRLRRPVLVGLVRPTILVPSAWDRPECAEALRLGLLHELVHAERRDTWFGLAGSLAQAFWFFLPPLWWVRAQMRLDQEFLADRRASAGFGPFGTYAAGLVDLAATASAPASPPAGRAAGHRPGPGIDGGGSPLFLRVLMLMRCPFPVELRPPRWWRWSLVVVGTLGTLLASSLSLRGAAPPATAATAAINRSAAAHGSFQIDRLRISPSNGEGRADPYTLMIELPPRFDLTLEIWATPDDLPEIRVAGQRLGPLRSGTVATPLAEGFQHVQIHRGPCGLSVRVAGREVIPEPNPPPIPRWLSIRPAPHEIGQVRNLTLTW